jgi:hypothetical protein
MSRQKFLLVFSVSLFSALLIGAGTAQAYSTYSQNNCDRCHGDFLYDPYVSLSDGQSWEDSLHSVHQSMVSFDCATCHTGGRGGGNVLIRTSDGGTGLDPIGCVGCHGRAEDDASSPPNGGYGAGLRQHHNGAGAATCGGCHSDNTPSDDDVDESFLPLYYADSAGSDSAHPNIPSDPCNPGGVGEDYAGSTLGLDNDGNGVYDDSDDACAAATPTPSATPTATPTPENECQCVPHRVVPSGNLAVVKKTTSSGRGSTQTKKVGVVLKARESTRGGCRLRSSTDTFSLRLHMVDANGEVILDETRTGLTCDRRVSQQKFMATYEVENCAESEPSGKSSKGKADKGSKSKVTVTATTEDGELIAKRTLKCNK